jgi:plasmid stabilization system protein ParE
MPDPSGQWNVRLATRAEKDLREIVAWTAEQFGEKQARVDAGTLSAAIVVLKGGRTSLPCVGAARLVRGYAPSMAHG